MSDMETGVIVCPHIFHDERPILYVEHSSDGAWQFLCGQDDHDDIEGAEIVGVNHLLERDPSLSDVLALAEGSCAERDDPNGEWRVSACPDDEDEGEDGA